MEMVRIAGLSLTAVVLLLILRQEKPVMAVLLGIGYSLFVFFRLLEPLQAVVETLTRLTEQSGVKTFFMKNILKILGIAYLAEFAAVLCADAGEQAVAKKVEFAARVLIAVLALPVITAILETLTGLLPG